MNGSPGMIEARESTPRKPSSPWSSRRRGPSTTASAGPTGPPARAPRYSYTIPAHRPQLRHGAVEAPGGLAVHAEQGFLDRVVAPVGAVGIAIHERVAGNDRGARVHAAHAVQPLVQPQALPVHHGARGVDRPARARRLVFVIQRHPLALDLLVCGVLAFQVAGAGPLLVLAVVV